MAARFGPSFPFTRSGDIVGCDAGIPFNPVECERFESGAAVAFQQVARVQHRRQDLLGGVGRMAVVLQLGNDRALPFDAIIRLRKILLGSSEVIQTVLGRCQRLTTAARIEQGLGRRTLNARELAFGHQAAYGMAAQDLPPEVRDAFDQLKALRQPDPTIFHGEKRRSTGGVALAHRFRARR